MSEVVVTPESAAAVVVDSSTAKLNNTPENEKPAWLDARLERERAKVLKDLGIDSVDDAKKALAELNAKREAEKTAAQKAADLETSLKATKAENENMASALNAYAKAQMGTLTEAQRQAVVGVAGEDPAKQLKTIEALKPTWVSASAPAVPAVEAPKDTAPAPAAPKDGTTSSPPDSKAIHAELKKTNPILAARYALSNGIFDNF